MMRRRSPLESYDIDHDQTLHDYPDDVDIGPDAKRATSSCISINNTTSGRIQSPKSEDAGSNDSDGVLSTYVPWNSRTNSPTASVDALTAYDTTSITVHMSILQELGTGQAQEEAYHPRGQGWMDNAVVWRRCPYLDETPMVIGSPANSSYPSMADEELELATVAADPDDERQHEERRIAERFASYKSRSAGAVESGSGTPKNRRRNKRKGCDSPRPPPDDPSPQTVPEESLLTSQHDTLENGQGRSCEQVNEENSERFANFDDLALWRMDSECARRFASEVPDDNSSDGSEPITSHGMRPGRGWALVDVPDDEDDEVTVSPRVMSPELDEPAGSLHVRAFHKRCNEPQERRTTFVALGNLNTLRSSSPMMIVSEPDENPATQRARQLVQLIQSLKDKVKLYEDAFEQRYGYRPSHHQKMDDRNTKRVLTELARSRKELKQLKERYRLSDSLGIETAETRDPTGVTTTATFVSVERSNAPTVEQTVLEVQEHLAGNRQLAGRSEMVEELSPKEVLDEKLAVQRALLYVESLHGRPASYKHKDLLRPLYDRYRLLKRAVVRSGLSRSKEEVCDLAPILEYEPLELSETRVTHRHSAPPTPSLESMETSNDQPSSPRPSGRRHTAPASGSEKSMSTSMSSWCGSDSPLLTWKRQKISLNIEENLHALPLNQLVEQMRHVRDEKRRLRRAIRDMEADVLRQQSATSIRYSNGTTVTDVDETSHPLEPVYAQYRHARAKLRLLEALVAKHDGSATL